MSFSTRLIYRLRRTEPFVIEGFLCACCTWAAKCLLWGPPNFARNPAAYDLMRAILGERGWAVIALVGMVGTLLGMLPLRQHRSAIRILGLGASAFLFGVAGGSFVRSNPDAISGLPLILIGLLAIGRLSAWPSGTEGSG